MPTYSYQIWFNRNPMPAEFTGSERDGWAPEGKRVSRSDAFQALLEHEDGAARTPQGSIALIRWVPGAVLREHWVYRDGNPRDGAWLELRIQHDAIEIPDHF